jgi:hypothetical protein
MPVSYIYVLFILFLKSLLTAIAGHDRSDRTAVMGLCEQDRQYGQDRTVLITVIYGHDMTTPIAMTGQPAPP